MLPSHRIARAFYLTAYSVSVAMALGHGFYAAYEFDPLVATFFGFALYWLVYVVPRQWRDNA